MIILSAHSGNGRANHSLGVNDRRAVTKKHAYSLLYFLGLLVMLLVGPVSCATAADASITNLLEIQRAKNALLEAELNHLRKGLTAHPRDMEKYLGTDLRSIPVPAQLQTHRDGASSGQSLRTMGELLEQATVLVLVLSKEGANIGTGFFVNQNTILTNKHVIDKKNAKILIVNQKIGAVVPATLRAVSFNAARDYALLTIDAAKIPEVTPLRFSTNAQRTDKVSTWGYPFSVSLNDPQFQALAGGALSAAPEVVYSEGVISVVLAQTPPVIMHSAMISHGNSGGPLVNQQGDVIGINTRITLDRDSYRQMGISLASSDIVTFLKDNGVTPIIVPTMR